METTRCQNIEIQKIMIKKAVIFFLTIIMGGGYLYSQDVNSMYFMKGVPQSYHVNPAYQPDCNTFIGLPGLSPLKLETSSSSLSLEDVIQYDPELDSLVFFLHPNGMTLARLRKNL